HIVGGCSPDLLTYKRELDARISHYSLEGHVRFWQHLPFSQVVGLYKSCDAFLLMSEHEGFCVPVLEAQFAGLPVVAHASTAVIETLGENQLCLEGLKYERYAAALHLLRDAKFA